MEPKGKPTIDTMETTFDICKYFSGEKVTSADMEIKGVNMDVTGDGLSDDVIVMTETTYRCNGKFSTDTAELLMEVGRNQKNTSSVKNAKGKTFKLGNVVTVKGSKYVLVAIPPQPAPFDGDKVDRDKLIVILFSMDTLEKIRTNGAIDKKIIGLVQNTTIAARLNEIDNAHSLSRERNSTDYEAILGTFLNGSSAPLMKVATQIAMENILAPESKKKRHDMGANGNPTIGEKETTFDVCKYFSDEKVTSAKKEIKGVKMDVTGDGIMDNVVVMTETAYRCNGKISANTSRLLMEVGRSQKDILSVKNAKGKTFKLGNVVTVKGSKYVLVAIPPQPAPLDGDKVDRDRLIVILFSMNTLGKIRTKGAIDKEIVGLVQNTTIAVRLNEIDNAHSLSIERNSADYEAILGIFLNGSSAPIMKIAVQIAMEKILAPENGKR